MGSDWQVNFGEDNISCLNSSKNAGLNDENNGGNLSGTERKLAECIAAGIC